MSKKILFTFLLQAIITYFELQAIYFFLLIFDFGADFSGFDGIVGLILNVVILGSIANIATIGICTVIGLPLRIFKPLHSFWAKNFYLAYLGIFVGFGLLLLAYIFTNTMSMPPSFGSQFGVSQISDSRVVQVPNLVLIIISWFIIAFSTLHAYLPGKKD